MPETLGTRQSRQMKETKAYNRLFFRTVNKHGWHQVAAVSFLVLCTFGILGIIVFARNPDESWIWPALGAVMCLAGLFAFFDLMQRWPKQILRLEIKGGEVKGQTVFGKEISFDMKTIAKFQKNHKFNMVELVADDNRRFLICPDIDFLGFFYDFILEKNPEIDFPPEVEEKFRGDPEYWSYSRRRPFNTKYPDGYLESFLPLLQEQRERMIAKGALKKDVFYGDKES